MRRGRPGPARLVRSVSCTDREWELVRGRAAARGLGIAAHLIECGLTVDPSPPPGDGGPRLVLTAAEQRLLRDRVAAVAGRMLGDAAPEQAWMVELWGTLKALLETGMLDLLGRGEGERMDALLAEHFGARGARLGRHYRAVARERGIVG